MYKIYLQFPWKFVDSQYYKYLLEYPPEGFIYLNKKKSKIGIVSNPKKFYIYQLIKKIGRNTLNKLYISTPSIKLNKLEIDLIHCARCFSLRNNYVVDAEYYQSLTYDQGKASNSKYTIDIIKKILEKDNCKKILPWTYASYYSFPKEIREDQKIKDKFEVLYPAVPEPKIKKIKHEKLTILFIGRYFYAKGGHYALLLFKKLKEKYDTETILISYTIPDNLKNKYEKYGIKIYKFVSAEDLYNKIYPSTDILFYPGFSDSFGFAFIEALSYGIPIITYDNLSRKEIIENEKEGFIIENNWKNPINKIYEDLLNKFYEKTIELIENPSLLKEFSKNAYKKYKEKFSIEVRNKKLKKIYEEAIKL
jgi:glycosyltransferase involved in cell wall biosynthesis